MKLLRTLSTPRLLLLVLAVAAVAAGAAAIAVVAEGGGGPTPPPKSLASALHDAITAPEVPGVTARIKFTNKLFPSGALLGNVGSALMSGASGRLWATDDGRGRLELQSNAGDVQVVWNATTVTVYDASANAVYKAELPAAEPGANTHEHAGLPTVAEIEKLLRQLGTHATVSEAKPSDVAGQAAYTVAVSPKRDGGLLGSAELAWDAARGVPLRVAVYAKGSSSPVLELKATEISYAAVSGADVTATPPADAKTTDLGALSGGKTERKDKSAPITGLAAVQASAGFPVAAPATLVGLPREDVRLVGSKDSRSVLVLYGQGLGGIAVLEHALGAGGAKSGGGQLSGLPAVSLGGITGRELATPLGTIVEWQHGGVSTVLAGSLPASAAETAARQLR